MNKELRPATHEHLLDEMAARIEELERRVDGLLRVLRQPHVVSAMGLSDFEYLKAEGSGAPLDIRAMKHEGIRLQAVRQRREARVMDRLSRVSPERLDALLEPTERKRR